MFNETRKIMHSDIRTSAMCVRVSSLRSHSESVWIETEEPITVEQAQAAIAAAEGVTLQDDPANLVYPMPLETGGKAHRMHKHVTSHHDALPFRVPLQRHNLYRIYAPSSRLSARLLY